MCLCVGMRPWKQVLGEDRGMCFFESWRVICGCKPQNLCWVSNSSWVVCVMLSISPSTLFSETSLLLMHMVFWFYNDGLPTKDHQGSLYLYLPGSINAQHHSQLFIWVLRITFRPSSFGSSHFTKIELIPGNSSLVPTHLC